ncbi:AEC family transporter [Stagnimonas aquatica]|uniref:AEC family transporter n=1 Tax=Stagnimonas aquatica TaxID=2689987 RepID=A0A3N0VM71_9GAMM|nr:AEC family transporter [Stagnimonas aquatica]
MILLAVCMALGAITVRVRPDAAGWVPGLNGFVLNIAFPALVLELIPKLHLEHGLWFPVMAMWGTALGALALMVLLGRWLGWQRGTVGALALVAGFGNTSFTGIPLIEALRGKSHLGAAVLADQAGSFLALATLGVFTASWFAGTATSAREVLLRVAKFPPFIAMLAGFAVGALGGWPPLAEDVLHRIGVALSPMALFAVGLQFKPSDLAVHLKPMTAGLAWKLGLAPLLVVLTGRVLGVGSGTPYEVAVLQAATAPMISAGILAQQSGLAPALANTVVGVGILLSLATVPLWNLLLG